MNNTTRITIPAGFATAWWNRTGADFDGCRIVEQTLELTGPALVDLYTDAEHFSDEDPAAARVVSILDELDLP